MSSASLPSNCLTTSAGQLFHNSPFQTVKFVTTGEIFYRGRRIRPRYIPTENRRLLCLYGVFVRIGLDIGLTLRLTECEPEGDSTEDTQHRRNHENRRPGDLIGNGLPDMQGIRLKRGEMIL